MTDATEAARMILGGHYSAMAEAELARTVARALLAGRDEVIERCAQEAKEAGSVFLRDRQAFILNGPAGMVATIVEAIRALRSKP